MAAIQGIHVRGHEERSSPKPHVVYLIDVRTSVRSWQISRRYSEFVDLHNQVKKQTGVEAPVQLPSKHIFSFRKNDESILEERRAGLEQYLRAILSSKSSVWRECAAFNEFLEVPIDKHAIGKPLELQFTLLSWLDEHAELQDLVRNIRADINKRNSLSDMGDVTASHTSNVQAKKGLVALLDRIGALAVALETLGGQGIPQGELQRRSDMVARLQDDCEKLAKMLIAARQAPRRPGKSSEESTIIFARDALLSSKSHNDDRPVTRVFGGTTQETDKTRPLDDHSLLELQQTQMEQQDGQLSQLTAILRRQRQLGVAISNEIEQQNELLDDLSHNVDLVDRKLDSASKALRRL